MTSTADTKAPPAGAHGHADHSGHHDHGMGDGHSHGTRRSYLTGFALSVVLTAIPFWLVMGEVLADPTITTLLIMLCGVSQILVHMIYFLHMNAKAEGGWILMAAIFTIIVTLIALVGSLWVMYHLNANMMPGHVMQPPDVP